MFLTMSKDAFKRVGFPFREQTSKVESAQATAHQLKTVLFLQGEA